MAVSSFKFYESSNLFHGSLLYIMGTRLDMILLSLGESKSRVVWKKVEEEVTRLDQLFNKFDMESELSFVNHQAVHAPVHVGDELWAVLLDCERYHELTLGYFDITLKDFQQISLNLDERTLFFLSDGIRLDLGGYAKGYALEKVRCILQSEGVSKALVNFGNSSVLALGAHPYGENWSIGIPNPYIPQETLETVFLKDSALSTSGNMPTHTKHILNPHTGLYSEERRIVSVNTKNAVDAEVLSTALMVADTETASEILSHFQVDQYLPFIISV